jgi:hypothetical protein
MPDSKKMDPRAAIEHAGGAPLHEIWHGSEAVNYDPGDEDRSER